MFMIKFFLVIVYTESTRIRICVQKGEGGEGRGAGMDRYARGIENNESMMLIALS